MKNFLLISIILVLISCGEKTDETKATAYIPELVITDSLVIDNLTELALIDVKEDHSEYLFYDWATSELLRINPEGHILTKANRSEDGKDSFKSRYFSTATYMGEDKILILSHTGAFIFDLEFNLIEERELDFELITRRIVGSRAALTHKNFFYTFSLDKSESHEVNQSDDFNIAYPFITIRDLSSMKTLSSAFIPAESQVAINPGQYNNLDPIVKFFEDELFVLFPNSPEMYVYEFPELKLKRKWDLNPGKSYKQISPTRDEASFEGFLNALASSEYTNFVISNDYLLTQFDGFAPQEDVDKLPKENVGGPEFMELADKYKSIPNYQIFKSEEKIWQGNWDVNLWSVRDILYSNAKPGEDPDAVEKDVQTIYFYELK
ncbi:hypothetical protein SYJ56_22010 [Algoriphagus sp. D3-2-R+10]|uniref:hypothetical protein n=1 Tax=Algoriphagus aurantiacus TaxID=3103948 RepID=UPI002B38D14F|nr:hypothetical protein [Algoriphagus sp. D3-2-R+10]MEB2778004.1 hypothetical protein [Algoriphagus sp. D3-2-R+10]